MDSCIKKTSISYFANLWFRWRWRFRIKTVISRWWLVTLSGFLTISLTQAGPERRLSVPGGFRSAAGGDGARRRGAGTAGGRQWSGASESRRPLHWGDERSLAGGPELGLHACLWASRKPPVGGGDPAQPDPTLPGAPAHAGAGQRGEHQPQTDGLQHVLYSQEAWQQGISLVGIWSRLSWTEVASLVFFFPVWGQCVSTRVFRKKLWDL